MVPNIFLREKTRYHVVQLHLKPLHAQDARIHVELAHASIASSLHFLPPLEVEILTRKCYVGNYGLCTVLI